MLGKRLKMLRGNKTQTYVANGIGIPKITYVHYENGQKEPDFLTLKKIASFFHVSFDYLAIHSNQKTTTENQNPPIQLFRERLKKGREENKLSQEDIAKHAKVTVPYIKKLETKTEKLPGISTLYAIAEKLNVTPDYLAGFTEDKKGRSLYTPKPKDFIHLLRKDKVLHSELLSDDDTKKIMTVIEAMFWDAKEKNKRKK